MHYFHTTIWGITKNVIFGKSLQLVGAFYFLSTNHNQLKHFGYIYVATGQLCKIEQISVFNFYMFLYVEWSVNFEN